MSVFFTSDTHFHHKNILKYQSDERPFETMDEMIDEMVKRHNSVVKKNDDIYYLGDFAFANQNKIAAVLERLNGNKYLIFGNHDRQMKGDKVTQYFKWMRNYHELPIKGLGYKGKAPLVLFHYPIENWNRKHYGSYHLYGHTHSTDYDCKGRLNVGVDSHDLTPWSLAEVMETLESMDKVDE